MFPEIPPNVGRVLHTSARFQPSSSWRGIQLSGVKLKELLRGHVDKLKKRAALVEDSKELHLDGTATDAMIQTYEVLIDNIDDAALFDFSFGEIWDLVARGELPR